MRLPLIKHIVEFIENNDEDYIIEALEVLEIYFFYITSFTQLSHIIYINNSK
jgi:hypothetical protein